MTHIETMTRAINFIEAHLQDEMTLTDVADAVSYSLYHFCRVFSATVHHTPYDYLMRRRLSKSAADLLKTDKKVIDIAFDYQFNNAETYSRAFKRLFHSLPSQWRKQAQPEQWHRMPRLTLAHLKHRNPKSQLGPMQIKIDKLHLIGIMSLLDNEPTHWMNKMWQALQSSFSAQGAAFGLYMFPSLSDRSLRFYMAGVCKTESALDNYPLVHKHLPAQRYALFHHQGTPESRYLIFDYIFHTWLPQAKHVMAQPYLLESFGDALPTTSNADMTWDVMVPLGD